MNVREQSLAIRAKREELNKMFPNGDCVCLTVRSTMHGTVGEMTVEVPVDIAAEAMFKGTLRLANADEIRAFRAAQAEERQRLQAQEAAKGTTYLIGHHIVAQQKGKRDGR
jgi:hypothetical protein